MARPNLLGRPILLILILAVLPAHAISTNPLTGTYFGTAVISAPVKVETTIDLAFYLDVTGTAIQKETSYIVLDKTLIYPEQGKILTRNGAPELNNGSTVACTADASSQVKCTVIGPQVSGTLSPTSFQLSTVAAFTSPFGDKTATRSIVLKNTTVANAGTLLTGDYEETVSGLGPNDITITGTFTIGKPSTVVSELAITDTNQNGCIDFADIKAGGSDPNVVEFSDISQALHLYTNSTLTPTICSPKDQVINQALTDYYTNTLK
jgi:hypothetical protein